MLLAVCVVHQWVQDLYGGQSSSNLGLTMPRNPYAVMETGTGINPPSSFGQMPAGLSMKDLMSAGGMLGNIFGSKQPKAPLQEMPKMTPLQAAQLPSGSNLTYEQLLKMYGVRGGGLLG